jgi:2-oxoglutarate ferredoxin oxidoreductase subunit delta
MRLETDELMSHVTIDVEKCKGCGICVRFCHNAVLVLSESANASGALYPLLLKAGKKGKPCNGCANCGIVCPDMCIEVWRTVEPGGDKGKR